MRTLARNLVSVFQFLLMMYAIALIKLPKDLIPINLSIEESWQYALQVAFTQQMRFGVDFVFNFGPWGFFLHPMFFPSTLAWNFYGRLAFAAIQAMGMFTMLRHRPAWCRWVAPLVLWIWLPTVGEYLPILLYFLLIWKEYNQPVNEANADVSNSKSWFGTMASLSLERGALVLLAGLLGWLSLMKFSYLIASLAVLVPSTLCDAARRRLPISILVFVVSMVGFWLLAGQVLSDLPTYIERSIWITQAYGQGMGTWAEGAQQLTFLIGAALLLGLMLKQAERLPKLEFASVAIAGIGLIFLLDKAHFFRAGPDRSNEALSLLVIWSYLIAATMRSSQRASKLLLPALVFGLATMHFSLSPHYWHKREINQRIEGFNPFMLMSYWFALNESAMIKRELLKAQEGEIRRVDELPNFIGSADLHPHDLGLLLAQLSVGRTYQPRPCIQSYQACSSKLNQLNASHLAGTRAPDNLFLQIESIDNRLRGLDESCSLLEMLVRYQFVNQSKHYLWLTKRPQPSPFTLKPLGTVNARLNQAIAIPSGKLVWAKLQLKPTLMGRTMSTLIRPINPTMTISEVTGTIVPDALAPGFFVSPSFRTTAGFQQLLQTLRAEPADSMTISASPTFWQENFQIEFFDVVIN